MARNPRLPIPPARITHYPMTSYIQWDSGSDGGTDSEFEYDDDEDCDDALTCISAVSDWSDPDGLDPEDRAIYEKYYRRKGCGESLDEFCPHVLDTISEFSCEGDEEDLFADVAEPAAGDQPLAVDDGMEIPCVMGCLMPNWSAHGNDAITLADACEEYLGESEADGDAATAAVPREPPAPPPRTTTLRLVARKSPLSTTAESAGSLPAPLVQQCEICESECAAAVLPLPSTSAVESYSSQCLLTSALSVPRFAFDTYVIAITQFRENLRMSIPRLVTPLLASLLICQQVWLAGRTVRALFGDMREWALDDNLAEHWLRVDFAVRYFEQGRWLVGVGHVILALAVGSWILGVGRKTQ
ncbi:hypothetical protein HDU86_003334 [Geranomyces michiganensis]|nr:hypothetical protein HDU86_003334 [Geranomyces michiganensis]